MTRLKTLYMYVRMYVLNYCITWEIFREINFTVTLFTKEVTFTEFFQKTVIQKFRNLHSVQLGRNKNLLWLVEKFVKSSYTLCWKCKTNWFDGIFQNYYRNSSNEYFVKSTLGTVQCGNMKNLLSLKKYFVKSSL